MDADVQRVDARQYSWTRTARRSVGAAGKQWRHADISHDAECLQVCHGGGTKKDFLTSISSVLINFVSNHEP